MNRIFIFLILSVFCVPFVSSAQPASAVVEPDFVKQINRFVRGNFSISSLERLGKYLTVLDERPDEEQSRVIGAPIVQARDYIVREMRALVASNIQSFLPEVEKLKRMVSEYQSPFVKKLMNDAFSTLLSEYDQKKENNTNVAIAFVREYSRSNNGIDLFKIMLELYRKWLLGETVAVASHPPHQLVILPEVSHNVANMVFGLAFTRNSCTSHNVNDVGLLGTSSDLKKLADTITTEHRARNSKVEEVGVIAKSLRNLSLRIEIQRAGLGIMCPIRAMQADKKTLRVADRAFFSLTSDDLSRRLDILKEVKAFAERFSCGDYGKETLSELEESLLLLRALMSRDYPHFNYLMIAEKCRVRDELVLAAINYQQAIIWAPDALLRKDFVSRLFRILPDSFAGYERWKASVRQEYTDSRYLVKAIDELREEHKKLLSLYGDDGSEIVVLNLDQNSTMLEDSIQHGSAESVAPFARVSRPRARRTRVQADYQEFLPQLINGEFLRLEEQRKMREEIRLNHAAAKAREEQKAAAKESKSAAMPVASSAAAEDDDARVTVTPVVAQLTSANHSIFLRFFQNKTGESVTLANADEWVHTTWQDNVKVTRRQLESLIENLGGKIKPGKGSHEKMTIPALQGFTSCIELSALCDPRLGSQTATVTSGREGFIPPYQIEQIRSKLMALGLVPATVIAVRT